MGVFRGPFFFLGHSLAQCPSSLQYAHWFFPNAGRVGRQLLPTAARRHNWRSLSPESGTVAASMMRAVLRVWRSAALACFSSGVSWVLKTLSATVIKSWILFSPRRSSFCNFSLMLGAAWLQNALSKQSECLLLLDPWGCIV